MISYNWSPETVFQTVYSYGNPTQNRLPSDLALNDFEVYQQIK